MVRQTLRFRFESECVSSQQPLKVRWWSWDLGGPTRRTGRLAREGIGAVNPKGVREWAVQESIVEGWLRFAMFLCGKSDLLSIYIFVTGAFDLFVGVCSIAQSFSALTKSLQPTYMK